MPADVTKTPGPAAITTPATQKSGIGMLEFTDDCPTRDTAAKLRDHLDHLHGVETFMNSIQGISTHIHPALAADFQSMHLDPVRVE
jgi:hypothetical protein